MRLLDLFCGAGGAAMGYSQAGFTEIVGVDIEPQPNYPFEFVQSDALEPDYRGRSIVELLGEFDLIHASPPCQRFSTSTAEPESHPDLIEPTRELLKASGVPYVIENVRRAPLHASLMLCGSMFGLDVQRHRYFETSGLPLVMPPPCDHTWKTGRARTVTGHAAGRNGQWNKHSRKYADLEEAQELMEMPWCTRTSEIVEAIPPAYTKFIGEQFINQLEVSSE